MCVPRAKGRPQKSATSRRQQAAQGRSTSSQTQEIAHAQSQAESFPRTAIIDLSTWSVQNTCFGEIPRGPCSTLLPPAYWRKWHIILSNCLNVRIDRIKTNQQRTVAILYTLCFGLSQVCNWLQTDNVIFLHQ